MVHYFMTEADVKAIEYLIIKNNILLSMKDINKALERKKLEKNIQMIKDSKNKVKSEVKSQ